MRAFRAPLSLHTNTDAHTRTHTHTYIHTCTGSDDAFCLLLRGERHKSISSTSFFEAARELFVLHACMFVCIYIYIYIHTYLGIHGRINAYIHAYIWYNTIHTYNSVSVMIISKSLHVCMFVCMYLGMNAHIHAYIHTYIHTCSKSCALKLQLCACDHCIEIGCMFVCMCVCIYVSCSWFKLNGLCLNMHIYTHTYMQT
jgi:hypothetical protein